MLTVQYARALDGILVNAADPGFTGTDFNNHRGTQTDRRHGRPPGPGARPMPGRPVTAGRLALCPACKDHPR
jgi:NAD(P)-dependent dehydrogenase (short-subunit alcohol dehydrogenase family)